MKSRFLDKLIDRVDTIDPEQIQATLVQLIQEKGFFEKVFEALQEGVILTEPGGEVTYLNGAACRLFGADPAAVEGGPITALIRNLEWDALEEAVRSGKVVSRDLEVTYPEPRFLNFYLTAVSEEEAGTAGYVMLVRDVTQSRQVAEEKIETERLNALTMLSAGVAHELGNPLNSVHIHLQLLERKLKKADPAVFDEVSDVLGVATGEITRLDNIIERFLRAVRPTQPQLELTDINRLLGESVRFLEPELKDRSLTTRLELHNALPLIQVDPDQMKQAFYNLIRNSAQAMAHGGELTVQTDVDDLEVRVRVSDTGDGIPEEAMAQLFEPYTTTKEGGSGLGLLIVRRIAREHGGELQIESEAGSGTAVTVHLPLRERGVRLLPEPDDDDGAVRTVDIEAEAEPSPADS